MRSIGAAPSSAASAIMAWRRSTLAFCARLEGRARGAEGLVPLRLQFGEHLLADVAGIAPAIGELVQRAVVRLQVGRIAHARRPRP